jgi:hypothetical protein
VSSDGLGTWDHTEQGLVGVGSGIGADELAEAGMDARELAAGRPAEGRRRGGATLAPALFLLMGERGTMTGLALF